MKQDSSNQSKRNIKNLKPSKSSRYNQGYINPNSCKKLFPGLNNEPIIYRSSYEKKFIYWLENNKTIKYWGSECFFINYTSIIDGKIHRYFPDYFIEFIDGTKMVVEIKPYNQTHKPINENNIWANKEYMKNISKWKAAKEYCDARGYKFKILTENTINFL